MAPFLQILSSAHALPKLIESLGKAIAGIKSAQGKKDLALFKIEVIRALEQVQKIAKRESERIDSLQAHNLLLMEHIRYLSLPFYRRWFTPAPKPLKDPLFELDGVDLLEDLDLE